MSTASITLRTGLPGSGKSLRTIERILEELEKGTIVYTCNINDLSIKGVIDFPDPTKWQELPSNSILFVDECQRFFPSRRAGEVPSHIRAMETIRHAGVRLELITQRPTYIDSHIRGLCGIHEHLLRKNGQEASQLFRWDEVEDEPKSDNARRKADVTTYHFRPSLFQHYKSAEIHTMKRRFNWRTKKGMGIFAVAALLCGTVGWFFYTTVFAAWTQDDHQAEVVAGSAATPTTGTTPPVALDPSEDPVLKFNPRIEGMPWTAPAYDQFEVRDYPRAFCIIVGDQSKERITCNCYTQQATPLDMEDRVCVSMARNGYFDPRLPPIGERERQEEPVGLAEVGEDQHPELPAPAPLTGIGAGIDRSLQQPYTPPDFLSR